MALAAMTRSRIVAEGSPGCAREISLKGRAEISHWISIRSINGPDILLR